MHSHRPAWWFSLVFVAAGGALWAQAPAATSPPLRLAPNAIETFVAEQLAAKDLVGLSLAVVRDGTPVLVKGFGKASLADNSPVTPQTKFAIGSITKQFTSAAILLLAEDGKLSPEDRVAKWYPDLTRANDITLRDLMNHVSGYRDYYPLDFVDRPMQKPIAVDDLIGQFGRQPLDFEPGTRYSYSNTGFLILGRVVEKVTGERFAAFLERRILGPMGMTHTAYEPRRRSPGVAQGYITFALSPPEPAIPEGEGWVAAAGALWSTPEDLVKWDLGLMNGKVLEPASYALMTTPRKLAGGSSTGYGCGLAVSTRNGQNVLGHNGAVAGFYAINTMIPATNSAVVLFSNFDSYDAVDDIYGGLMAAMPPPKGTASGTEEKKPETVTKTPPINGPLARDAARLLFAALQAGRVDRAQLGEEFNAYLTDEKIRRAAERLKPFGTPVAIEIQSLAERGGMEVARTKLSFASSRSLRGLMYRTPDGKVQQFFVLKD